MSSLFFEFCQKTKLRISRNFERLYICISDTPDHFFLEIST